MEIKNIYIFYFKSKVVISEEERGCDKWDELIGQQN